MKLKEAIDRGTRFAVAVRFRLEMLAAEVYIVEGGVVFLDPGWSEPIAPRPRALFEAGEVEGEGPWRVGSWRIREVHPETDPEYVEEWARWEGFRTETNATRERGAEYASKLLAMTVKS